MPVAPSALRAQPMRYDSRRALSLIEVTIAIMVLAVSLTVMLGDFLSSQRARNFAAEQAKVQEVSRTVLNRLLNAPVAMLGVSTSPWGLARHEDANDTPLVDAPGPVNSLITMGLRTSTSGVPDLQMYVEYYRGIAASDPSSGSPALLAGVFDSFTAGSDPAVSMSSFRSSTWRAARRLSSANPPSLQVPQNTPVMIRLITTWNQGSQRLELHGARLF